jgi:diguanylate cyclase (GGDEF)-like protein
VDQLMERVRKAAERTPLTGESLQPVGPVTISIGVAFGPEDSHEPEALIKMADAALYDAKRAGRNQVCVYLAVEDLVTADESLRTAA